jgi:hypothetical protein
MATVTDNIVKAVSVGQMVEIILAQLPPEERAVVRWNITSPQRVRRLAEDAVVLGGDRDGDELLVADVSPNYVLSFRETPTEFALLDLMNKAALKWEAFPVPVETRPEWPAAYRLDGPGAEPTPANGVAHK